MFHFFEKVNFQNVKCQLLKMTIEYCHFNKTIKRPGTSFQSAAVNQKDVKNIYHAAH